ncbi:FkbM family methyltransferase [Ktedonosporobacter rubrisoli]|uniref:FkbM family methyltransferase n=1 Tax=Ktedonosporobacter rubrisoli TaxID=2509675 RepID=A0A4P6JPR7_KTERU|nr:FkbM family methyltransferase [Ktedonosporobacter rubrisoli]QBD77285.1 FkbM family methyltransferase [Ktedonosporobacter rubrisoli]
MYISTEGFQMREHQQWPAMNLKKVEEVLNCHPDIQKAVVIVQEDTFGQEHLVAYLVPDPSRSGPLGQLLRLECAGTLAQHPTYELPNGMTVFQKGRNETELIYREIFEDKHYLSESMCLPEHACVFDVGANIGLFSLFIHQLCPTACIYAFEPIPSVFELLQLNMSLYAVQAHPFACGLSKEDKSELFTYYPHCSLLSGFLAQDEQERDVVKTFLLNQQQINESKQIPSLDELDTLLKERLITEQFVCPVKTVSSIMREQEIEQIDLLKIDVEKSELDVLLGIEEHDWLRIGQIVIEVHDLDDRVAQIQALLQRHGYRLHLTQDRFLEGTGLHYISAVQERYRPTSTAKIDLHREQTEDRGWQSPKALCDAVMQFSTTYLAPWELPSDFILLEHFPLFPDGRVDTSALPPLREQACSSKRSYTPETDEERILADIWTQILPVAKVQRHDNFFLLGGDSILGMQVVAQAREKGIDMNIMHLFQHPILTELAATVPSLPSTTKEER